MSIKRALPAILLALLALSPLGVFAADAVAVREIPLEGPASTREAEISGLAWHGAMLILLPQYPERFMEDGRRRLFGLRKQLILAFLDGRIKGPLTPTSIYFDDAGASEVVPGFQGFEALAVIGRKAYLSIEAKRPDGGMNGFVARANFRSDGLALAVEPADLQGLRPPVSLSNMGYEALAAGGRSLLALFEANGANVNPTPSAARLDPENLRIEDRPSMPVIEYRLTDATDMDGNGVFFVTNYFWPGERDVLDPAEDKLNSSLLRGSLNRAVERIVPLRYDGEKLEVAGEPINLKRERDSRNWEGIARLDDRGFLIATDKFPRTILGFVEKPAR